MNGYAWRLSTSRHNKHRKVKAPGRYPRLARWSPSYQFRMMMDGTDLAVNARKRKGRCYWLKAVTP